MSKTMVSKTTSAKGVFEALEFGTVEKSHKFLSRRNGFYYRGTGSVVAITIDGDNALTFSNPQGGGTENLFSLLETQFPDIKLEARTLLGDNLVGSSFLWDYVTKRIITDESMVDFVPHKNGGKALIAFYKEDNTIELPFYYLADQSKWGALAFAMLSEAKVNLIHPKPGKAWLFDSKKLLTFLLSKYYDLPMEFNSEYGPWQIVYIGFGSDEHPDGGQEMSPIYKKMSFSRLLSLGSAKEFPSVERVPPEISGEGGFCLSFLIEWGMNELAKFAPGRIDITIDILGDRYNKISYEPSTGMWTVYLQRGCTIKREEVLEDLGIEDFELNLFSGLDTI